MPQKNMPVKSKEIEPKPQKRDSMQDVSKELMKNNIILQSKIIELVKSNNELLKSQAAMTDEIKSMVTLFKEAGEQMIAETEEEKLRPLLGRISELVEQNKGIMRGLILIQKYIRVSTTSEMPQQKPFNAEEF